MPVQVLALAKNADDTPLARVEFALRTVAH